MRLTFTIDVPIKNPEELLDLNQLNKQENTSYVLLDENGKPKHNIQNMNIQQILDKSQLTAKLVLGRKIEMDAIISKIREKNPSFLSLEHTFPTSFAMKYPEQKVEYERMQARYNGLRNETFLLLEVLTELTENFEILSEMTQSVIDNGFYSENLLKEKLSEMENELKEQDENSKEHQRMLNNKIQKLENRVNPLQKMCDEKDVLITNLQMQLNELRNRNDSLENDVHRLEADIRGLKTNPEEINRYITSMYSDKKDLLVILEQQAKKIAELEVALTTEQQTVQSRIEKLNAVHELEVDRIRRKLEGEITKLKASG